MQAALPDINTAIIKYRTTVTARLDRSDYTGCFGGLYAINALLPVEYRVIISDHDYNELNKQDVFITCTNCNKENNFKNIKIYNFLLPSITTFTTGKVYEKMWICTECKKDNRLSLSKIKQTKLRPDSYNHVMPEPPRREEGILDRTSYHNKVAQYVWAFLTELEERCSKLRFDNLNKEDGMEELLNNEE